jgi:hypothetical protein
MKKFNSEDVDFPGDKSRFSRFQEELDALQDEIAGRGASRQSRLGRTREESEARRSGRTSNIGQYANQLQMLLATDPEYRAAYETTLDVLTEAESEADQKITDLEAAIQEQNEQLDALTRRAAALPDGTKGFRAADGTVWTEDGQDVSHLATHIEWKGHEPSWEDYVRQREKAAELQTQLDAWRHYQVDVLGGARERLSDPDNPPSKDELDEIMRDIKDKAPSALQHSPEAEPEAQLSAPVASAAIPTI